MEQVFSIWQRYAEGSLSVPAVHREPLLA